VPAAEPSRVAVKGAVDAATQSPGSRAERIRAALTRFIESRDRVQGRSFIRGVVVKKLYGKNPHKIDPDLVDELTQLAAIRALEAKTPPLTERGIPGWVSRVSRRAIAEFFRGRQDDKAYLNRDVDAAEEGGDRHEPAPDWGAREHLIAKFLEDRIGDDARRKDTFRLMMEHEVAGHDLADLAAANRTTPSALKSRFYKLRKELVPAVSIMDKEKPRRAILLALLFGGLLAVVAMVVALWSWLQPAPPPVPPPPAPVPSASASAAPEPTLDIARPPPVVPALPDAGDLKTPPR
jgi:DNA-directed RNA polymerase specialized sigma24 family protein